MTSTAIFKTNHELRTEFIEATLERYLNHADFDKFKTEMKNSRYKFSDNAIEQILKKYNLTK